MLNVMKIANSMGIPVLPLHDEVVFPENEQSDVEDILKEAFKWTFNDAVDFGAIKVNRSDTQLKLTFSSLKLSEIRYDHIFRLMCAIN